MSPRIRAVVVSRDEAAEVLYPARVGEVALPRPIRAILDRSSVPRASQVHAALLVALSRIAFLERWRREEGRPNLQGLGRWPDAFIVRVLA